MKKIYIYFALLIFILPACQKESTLEDNQAPTAQPTALAFRTAATFPETFELGTKTSYTTGNITLGSGSWNFTDALIGTSTTDRKTGSKSARIQNAGKIEMNFNTPSGVNFVSVQHAKFSTSANSTWQLFYSTNSGSSWTQAGSTITTSSTTLVTTTFTVNLTVAARFRIVKLTGGGILNIDNVLIDEPGDSPTLDDNLALGNPSNATVNLATPNNYLLVKPQYVMSYNNARGSANWVSWHLSSAWKGTAARCDCFSQDTQIPTTMYRASTSSFSGSGFDRGHLCPSDDRDLNSTDNAATFKMSNMIPQAPNNNQITWGNFEDYCRTLLTQGNELYIIAGGYGSGGTGSNGGVTYTISNGLITVPARTWKVALVIPVGANDLSRVSTSTRVIAIDMPNTQTVNDQTWQYYRTTVDNIEAQTGLDFFSNVSTTIQSSFEAVVDAQ